MRVNERADTVKAAVWSGVAALALSLHIVLAAPIGGPPLYGILAVLGFGLLLPVIATLYVRFVTVGPHAAILTAIAGVATSISGVGALSFDDLEPAALLFLGTWWWVAGKFSVESGLLPRAFGYATMALAVLAFVAMIGDVLGARIAWTVARLALAAWLLVLATILYRSATRSVDAG